MGKAPCCSKVGLHRGPWSTKEDALLTKYIQENGEGHWRSMPKKAGLLRCGKSCRLRWMNYLRPGIKRGNISSDEEDLIIRLHALLGNRWSLIAGRLPGRTDNEIKNYWNTHLVKRLISSGIEAEPNKTGAKRPKKESKRKSKATVGSETTGAQTKPTNNTATNISIDQEGSDDREAVVEKIKVYAPKPRRVSSGFSSNNTVDSGLSSSSANQEVVVNKAAGEDMVCHFDDQDGKAEMSYFDWPLIELGDANYGTFHHVCEDDRVLIGGCDFSIQDSMPIIGNMLEQVYDEYLQLL